MSAEGIWRFPGSISQGRDSLGMGQGRRVQGRTPQFSSSCRRAHCLPGVGVVMRSQWGEPMAIASGSSQKRKVKSDPMKKLRSSLDFTWGNCNHWLFRPSAQSWTSFLWWTGPHAEGPTPPEPPRWGLSTWRGWGGWTKNSANNTWRRFGYKHAALLGVPAPPRPHSCPGPDAKTGKGARPWRLHGAQGKVRSSSTGRGRTAGWPLIK